jgi:hypothetical protein
MSMSALARNPVICPTYPSAQCPYSVERGVGLHCEVEADLGLIRQRRIVMDSGQLQSKQPRSALAGSYGHPVHPILVTVPIGAWVCSLVFDLVSYGSAEPRTWSVGAMWLVLFGAIGAALAAVWGVIEHRRARHRWCVRFPGRQARLPLRHKGGGRGRSGRGLPELGRNGHLSEKVIGGAPPEGGLVGGNPRRRSPRPSCRTTNRSSTLSPLGIRRAR